MGFEGKGKVVQPKIHISPAVCDCGCKLETDSQIPVIVICEACEKRNTVVADVSGNGGKDPKNWVGRDWLQLSEKTQDFSFKETGRSQN